MTLIKAFRADGIWDPVELLMKVRIEPLAMSRSELSQNDPMRARQFRLRRRNFERKVVKNQIILLLSNDGLNSLRMERFEDFTVVSRREDIITEERLDVDLALRREC